MISNNVTDDKQCGPKERERESDEVNLKWCRNDCVCVTERVAKRAWANKSKHVHTQTCKHNSIYKFGRWTLEIESTFGIFKCFEKCTREMLHNNRHLARLNRKWIYIETKDNNQFIADGNRREVYGSYWILRENNEHVHRSRSSVRKWSISMG